MTFDWHENERKMSVYLTNKAAEIARRLVPAKINMSSIKGKYNMVPYQSTHNTGGAVMGADPATSATRSCNRGMCLMSSSSAAARFSRTAPTLPPVR